ARTDVFLPSEVGYWLPNENRNSTGDYGFDGMIRFSGAVGAMNYSFAPNFTVSRSQTLTVYNERCASAWHRSRSGNNNNPAGRWQSTRFLYERIGQFTSWDEIARYPVEVDATAGGGNRSLLPGDYIYKDDNGDGVVNGSDQ